MIGPEETASLNVQRKPSVAKTCQDDWLFEVTVTAWTKRDASAGCEMRLSESRVSPKSTGFSCEISLLKLGLLGEYATFRCIHIPCVEDVYPPESSAMAGWKILALTSHGGFVSIQKLCIYIYTNLWIYIKLYDYMWIYST